MSETVTRPRIPLAEARALADALVDILRPACERIKIAGSIRRQKPTVSDIELVLVPKRHEVRDLLGEIVPDTYTDEFLELTDYLRDDGILPLRYDAAGHAVWGHRHRRALYHGFAVDRTGPADFSHALVTNCLASFPQRSGV